MTTTAEGWSDGHGTTFMGVYVRLLARYLRLDPADFARTARDDHIKIADDARPAFADATDHTWTPLCSNSGRRSSTGNKGDIKIP